jgi:hypothetical protein
MNIFSLISLFPPALCFDDVPLSCALIGDSQPTRCGHTLRGVHCRRLASGFAPSNPAKAKRHKP